VTCCASNSVVNVNMDECVDGDDDDDDERTVIMSEEPTTISQDGSRPL